MVKRQIWDLEIAGSNPVTPTIFLINRKKYNEKKEFNLIQITQNEANYLRSKKFGYLIHISSITHKGRAKRYYLTEDPKVLRVLKEYKENEVTYTYT